MDFSIGDDDDFDQILEENDAALQANEEAPPTPSAKDSFSDAADEGIEIDEITQADFALLPYVTELVDAHRAGDANAADLKMIALRRAARRANTRVAALTHAVSGPAAEPAAAQALLEAREALLVGAKRKLEESAAGS